MKTYMKPIISLFCLPGSLESVFAFNDIRYNILEKEKMNICSLLLYQWSMARRTDLNCKQAKTGFFPLCDTMFVAENERKYSVLFDAVTAEVKR